MVDQQYPQRYRWDFIGLSTDDKPTPATSEKVVNGSTFYCSDTSKLYVFCDGTWYERKALGGGGGGGGTEYTAGEGIDITNDVISVDTETIQPKLTAGSNISISDNTISATDTTYSSFTGTDGTTAGTAGLVPAPATTDADKFLKSDGTWAAAGGGSSVDVVQTTGTSQTAVMSQNATTSMVFHDPNTKREIQIGDGAMSTGTNTIAIGRNAKPMGNTGSIAIGVNTSTNNAQYSVALGYQSTATRKGEVNIGSGAYTAYGYNNSQYRVLGGVHDGVDAHDAVNVEQINALIDAINTAASTNIPHIGA